MKDRIRIGIRVNLPFGIFPNCATAVIHANFKDVQDKVNQLKEVLYRTGNSTAQEFADRLFVEKS